MKHWTLQLACAAAMGVLAAGAQAQYTAPAAPPAAAAPTAQPAANTDVKAQAEASYRDAQSICDKQLGTAKISCLRNAKADYERALKTGEIDTSTAQGPIPGGATGGGGSPSGMTGKQRH